MHTNKRLPLVIDLAFCLVLLPFMIWLLPVNRWAASNAPFVVLFVGWLYVVYFAYRYYAVPRMFRGHRQIVAAIAVIAVTLVVTWLISRPGSLQIRLDRQPFLKILDTRKLSERRLTTHGRKVTERQIPKVRHELKPANFFSQTQATRGAVSQTGKQFEDRVDKCRSLLPESECDSVGRIRAYNSLLNA